jgi:hypothetical protein
LEGLPQVDDPTEEFLIEKQLSLRPEEATTRNQRKVKQGPGIAQLVSQLILTGTF